MNKRGGLREESGVQATSFDPEGARVDYSSHIRFNAISSGRLFRNEVTGLIAPYTK